MWMLHTILASSNTTWSPSLSCNGKSSRVTVLTPGQNSRCPPLHHLTHFGRSSTGSNCSTGSSNSTCVWSSQNSYTYWVFSTCQALTKPEFLSSMHIELLPSHFPENWASLSSNSSSKLTHREASVNIWIQIYLQVLNHWFNIHWNKWMTLEQDVGVILAFTNWVTWCQVTHPHWALGKEGFLLLTSHDSKMHGKEHWAISWAKRSGARLKNKLVAISKSPAEPWLPAERAGFQEPAFPVDICFPLLAASVASKGCLDAQGKWSLSLTLFLAKEAQHLP